MDAAFVEVAKTCENYCYSYMAYFVFWEKQLVV